MLLRIWNLFLVVGYIFLLFIIILKPTQREVTYLKLLQKLYPLYSTISYSNQLINSKQYSNILSLSGAQSAGALEYTDYISAEG